MSKPDPTDAVMKHVKAAVKRLDDLQKLKNKSDNKLAKAEFKSIAANFKMLRALIQSAQDTATIQLDRLTNRVSALELTQSQSTGRSGISTQLLIAIAIVVGGIIGGIVMAYFKK
jgi:hypothetical protein